jgi:hypothetical protein
MNCVKFNGIIYSVSKELSLASARISEAQTKAAEDLKSTPMDAGSNPGQDNGEPANLEYPFGDILKMLNFAEILVKTNTYIKPLHYNHSLYEAYKYLLFMKFLRIDSASVYGKMNLNDVCKSYFGALIDRHFIYAINTIEADIIDINAIITKDNVFEVLSQMKSSKKGYNDFPELYIEILIILQKFDPIKGINKYNEEIAETIRVFRVKRNDAWKLLLLNPYKDIPRSYFDYESADSDCWEMPDISLVRPPQVGVNTIIDYEEFAARLEKFTYGFLSGTNDYGASFPTGVVIAGGSISKLMSSNCSDGILLPSDVDMCIYGSSFTERYNTFYNLVSWFDQRARKMGRAIYYALKSSLLTIYIAGINRKFQIIAGKNTNPYEIISEFDLSHVAWCYLNGEVYGLAQAFKSMKTKVSVKMNKIVGNKRLVKTFCCGYKVKRITDIKSISDMESLKNKEKLNQVLSEYNTWYYPTIDDGLAPLQAELHHIAMIRADSAYNIVTTSMDTVMDNIVIDGNFNNDYKATTMNLVNAIDICQKNEGPFCILRGENGNAVRLMSPPMVVDDITFYDDKMGIFIKVTDDIFREFCSKLENHIYRIYKAESVTKKIIDSKSICAFYIKNEKIKASHLNGRSIMVSSRGAPLDVEDDLSLGDVIQIVFLVKIVSLNSEKCVDLVPLKIIRK